MVELERMQHSVVGSDIMAVLVLTIDERSVDFFGKGVRSFVFKLIFIPHQETL